MESLTVVLRGRYAKHLRTLALDIVVLHELVHIFHGHTEYLRAAHCGKVRAPTPLECMALEFDADVSAFMLCAQIVDNLMRLQKTLPADAKFVWCETQEEMFRDIAIAAYSVFQLYQKAIQKRATFTHHPPPRQRQVNLLAQFSTWCERNIAEESERHKLRNIMMQAILACESAFHHLTGQQPHIESLVETIKDMTLVNQLWDGWASIHPDLLPYAYRKIAPRRPDYTGDRSD